MLVQAAVWPDVAQVQGPEVKVLGTVTPVGIVIVVVIGPCAGAVPILLTNTGKVVCTPGVSTPAGVPIVVVMSGTPITPGFNNKVIELLVNAVSPLFAAILAVNSTGTPTAAALAVNGKLKVLVEAGLNALTFVQVTVLTTVLQPQPLLTKLPGVVMPTGSLIVTVNMPAVLAVPTLSMVIGKLL